MEEITIQQFLEGYAQGYITDIVAVGNRVYGKDPRGQAYKQATFKIVWATIP